MRWRPEPPHQHGTAQRTAVLLVNLGTPAAPTASAVRRYLREFLWDPRVVEIPRPLWWLILHGVILRTRPARSAAKYASIWQPEGSPLALWTHKQAALLQGYLGERGHAVPVLPAMRYGQPAIGAALSVLREQGVQRVLVLPLYPQYAAATTASTFDAVARWAGGARVVPEFRFIQRFGADPGYIRALAGRVRTHWLQEGRGPMLVMSFHGLPQRSLTLGDPYHCECLQTARLLAQALGLQEGQYRVTFQSRLGRAKWLQPYTEPTLQQLARDGVDRVDVVCPGFPADCLETLEEINQEARQAFLAAGGKAFHYVPCLNDQHEWISALASLAEKHLQGWDTTLRPDATALQAQAERARARGAER